MFKSCWAQALCPAPVLDLAMREDIQSLHLRDRVGASVRFQACNDNVYAALRCCLSIREHLKRLADARCVAEINFKLAALGVFGCWHVES
jgi:hypothetical protein